MSITEVISRLNRVFSKRLGAQGQTDAPAEISQQTRNKVLLFYRDILHGVAPGGTVYGGLPSNADFVPEIHNLLEHSKGVGILSESARRLGILVDRDAVQRDLFSYLAVCSTVDFLDFLELSFQVGHPPELGQNSAQFIDAINQILEGEGTPYRLTGFVTTEEQEDYYGQTVTAVKVTQWPQVIEIADEITYQEAVKPALALLASPDCQAPNEELLKGMQHYRKGEYGDCLTACASAVESILKVICTRHGWNYNSNDTLAPLVDNVVPKLNLDPSYKERIKVLTTLRNRLGSAHGGGTTPRQPEKHVAQFMMTTSAAVIVFLVSVSDRILGR